MKGIVGYNGKRKRKDPVVVTRDSEGRLRGLPRHMHLKEQREQRELAEKQSRRKHNRLARKQARGR